MKKLVIITALMLSTILYPQVVCDEFDVQWSFINGKLSISLSTDLPDNTDLTIYSSRTYVLKENQEEYSVDYFNSKENAEYWKSEHSFKIDNDQWRTKLQKDLKQKAAFGMGSNFESIDDTVHVRVLVPARQSNPLFGKRNSKLSGKMVTKSTFPIVEYGFFIPLPLKGHPQITSYTNARSLKPSNTYVIPKRTPLMTEFNPSDVMGAINNSIWLEIGYRIKVINILYKNNIPWYQVKALTKDGQLIGDGWINSTALLGQTIEQVN